MRRAIHCLLLCLVAGAGFAGQCEAMQFLRPVVLLEAKFGLVGDDSAVKPADTVPLVEGNAYGVDVTFKQQTQGIVLRVELELPKAPKTWGGWKDEKGAKISADGKLLSYTTDANNDGTDTLVSWQVADGDPEGVYTVRLYIGDAKEPFRTFTFKVAKP